MSTTARLTARRHPLPKHSPSIAASPGPYKPRTGQCMNHAPAILAALALIYSTHQVLVVWIIVAHFHLCSLLGTLSRYTI